MPIFTKQLSLFSSSANRQQPVRAGHVSPATGSSAGRLRPNLSPFRLLFPHIPKTGGTSIVQMARDNGWTVDHTSYDEHATHHVYSQWDYNAAFTIVRDPVDRARSLLAMRHISAADAHDWLAAMIHHVRRLTSTQSIRQLQIDRTLGGVSAMVFPQTWYITKNVEVAYYGNESAILQKYFGTSTRPHLNPAPVPKPVLEPRTIALIHDFYAEDYATFSFGQASCPPPVPYPSSAGRSRPNLVPTRYSLLATRYSSFGGPSK